MNFTSIIQVVLFPFATVIFINTMGKITLERKSALATLHIQFQRRRFHRRCRRRHYYLAKLIQVHDLKLFEIC